MVGQLSPGCHEEIMAEVCVAVGRREARIEAGQAPSSPELSLEEDEDGDRSLLYMCAISGTNGSSGFGSVSREQIERSTWK